MYVVLIVLFINIIILIVLCFTMCAFAVYCGNLIHTRYLNVEFSKSFKFALIFFLNCSSYLCYLFILQVYIF